MTHHILRARAFKWAVLAIGALLAMRLFFVQQLIAALLIFSVLFACLAVLALILFALDLAWRFAFGRAETYVMALARSPRRSPVSVNNAAVANMLTPVLVHRVVSHK